jgi:hypothetical protein
MKAFITKAQAMKEFKAIYDTKGLTKTTRRRYWNEHTNHLYANNAISHKQWTTWTNPFK